MSIVDWQCDGKDSECDTLTISLATRCGLEAPAVDGTTEQQIHEEAHL